MPTEQDNHPSIDVHSIDDGRRWRVEIEGVGSSQCTRLTDVLPIVAELLPGTRTWLDVKISPVNPLHPGSVGNLLTADAYISGEEEVAVTTTHAGGVDLAWVHYVTHDSAGPEFRSLPLDLDQVRDLQRGLLDASRVLEFRTQIREARRTGTGAPDLGLLYGGPTLRSVEPIENDPS